MGSIISKIFKNQGGGNNKDSSKVHKKSGGKKSKRTKEVSAKKTRRELLKEIRSSRQDQGQSLTEEELLEMAQNGVSGPDISATPAGISVQATADSGHPDEELLIPEEQMADNQEVPVSGPEDGAIVGDTPVEESEKEKPGGNIFDLFSDDVEESKASKFAKNLGEVDIYDLLNSATSLKNELGSPED